MAVRLNRRTWRLIGPTLCKAKMDNSRQSSEKKKIGRPKDS